MQKQSISEQESQAAKKSYQTPQLTNLGSVEQLTEVMEINPGGSHICLFQPA
jgi:hypothetical protein